MERSQVQVILKLFSLILISLLSHSEYHQFVTIGQTHTLGVHQKFYALKRRRLEEAQQNGTLFNAHLNQNPLPAPSILQDDEEENHSSFPLAEHSDSSLQTSTPTPTDDSQRKENDQLLRNSNYTIFSNIPTPETLSAMNDLDFGIARNDIEKKGKRFDWIPEELDYLVLYIQTIEGDTTKNRYSNCLNHLRTEASPEIKSFFHPHHVANSDRLKNGFTVALKRLT